jgi:hypothetical protein
MTYKPAVHKMLGRPKRRWEDTFGSFLYDRHWPFGAAFIMTVVLMNDDDDDDND